MAKLRSVKIKRIIDYDADTSDLGEYTDDDDDFNICRHCGEFIIDAERYNRIIDLMDSEYESAEQEIENEKTWEIFDFAFLAVHNKFADKMHDCPHDSRAYNNFKPYAGGEEAGTKEYYEYGLQDFKRMEGLEHGDWHFVGVIAEAVVEYETETGNYRLETLTSSGLWGIESDAEDYLEEIEGEELASLKRHCEEFNVDLSKWSELTEDVERVDG